MPKEEREKNYPLLPLRDVVVFPHMVIPLFVGRSDSIRSLEEAMAEDKQVFLLAQKDAAIDSPKEEDLYRIGTLATILQLLRLPDGTVKVLVEGAKRAKLVEFIKNEKVSRAIIEVIENIDEQQTSEIEAMMRGVITQFESMVKANKKIPPELLVSLGGIEDAGRLADTVAAHMTIKVDARQKILETINIHERLTLLQKLLVEELEIIDVDKRVQGRVKQQVEKSQRQYYLSEKIKAIQQELGDLGEEGGGDEISQLVKNIKDAHMPKEAHEKAM